MDPQHRRLPGVRLGGAGGRRLRPGALRRARSASSPAPATQHLPASTCSPTPSWSSAVGDCQCVLRQRQATSWRPASPTSSTCAGPSLTVQTACSTSLVAVHLACQSLLRRVRHGARRRRLDPRAAAAATSTRRAGILSPDGHCRAFDAARRAARSRRRRGRRGAQAARRRAGRRRHHPRGDPRLGGQQRRRGQGRLHRAQRRRARPR